MDKLRGMKEEKILKISIAVGLAIAFFITIPLWFNEYKSIVWDIKLNRLILGMLIPVFTLLISLKIIFKLTIQDFVIITTLILTAFVFYATNAIKISEKITQIKYTNKVNCDTTTKYIEIINNDTLKEGQAATRRFIIQPYYQNIYTIEKQFGESAAISYIDNAAGLEHLNYVLTLFSDKSKLASDLKDYEIKNFEIIKSFYCN